MNKTQIKYLVLALILIFIGSYFRLYPFLYRTSSLAEEKATALIFTQLRTNVEEKINELYPQLNEDQKRLLTDKKVNDISYQKKKQIQRSIFNLAQKIYGRDLLEHPEKKEPEIYLPDSDSYYFYGLTKQLAENKPIMTKRKGAEYFNAMMLAPIGYWEKINLHPFVGFWTYKMMSFFNPQISPMLAVSFVPIFLTIFSILLFLLLLRHLQINTLASFLGSLVFVLAPIFLRRSFFGWYDNDVYNIFFPLLILWLTFIGLENSKHHIKRILFSLLTALAMISYAYFWQGWVYLFCLLFGGGILLLGLEFFIFKEKRSASNIFSFFVTTFIIIFSGVALSFGLNQTFFLFQEGWSVLGAFFHSSALSLWPDIYMSVGELNKTSWSNLFELAGSAWWFLVAMLGGICFILDHHSSASRKTIYKMTLVFLFAVTAFIMSLKAQRFVLLLVTPLGILAGYGFEKIFSEVDKSIKKFNPYKKAYTSIKIIIFGSIIAFFSVGPLLKTDDLASRIRPIFNETWERALVALKEKTPSESIINTWWPPGHFIKAIAERRVTFDGATINVPQAFWMARALYSPNEKRSLGILRMLNTSANKASEYLLSQGKKLSEAVDIIEEIVVLSKGKAKKFLLKTFTEEQADALLMLTHGEPPPSYLFFYNDMMETNIGIGFAARWNIKKMEQINENPDALKQVRKLAKADYITLLWDTQGGMLRYSEILNQVDQKDQKIYFNNGLMVDLSDMNVQISSEKFGAGIPKNLFYSSEAGFTKKEFVNASLPYSILLFKVNATRYSCILMDEVIAESVMARLYFLGPKDFTYIELFVDEHDLTGQTQLFAFKIDWKGFIKDLEANP
ncbi:MAG: STT3 domain-containing protein [Candidatus Omnitrophota bacterium]